MQTGRQHNTHARGFTLLELMMVVGIIALLAGLSYTIIGGALDTAKRTATLTTIAKINKVYEQKQGGFSRHLKDDKQRTNQLAGNFRSPGGQYPLTDNKDASIALVRKFLVKRQFPQYADETFGDDQTEATGDELQAFREWCRPATSGGGIGSAPPLTGFVADSSELLYLIITESTIPGASIVDTTEFSASELGDTDGDGWTEFIDAWGQPLRFYRWPTRLVNPGGFLAGRLSADVDNMQTNFPLGSGDGPLFNDILTTLQGVAPGATLLAEVGDEIVEVTSIAGDTLTVARGAVSTNASDHLGPVGSRPGAVVKVAPFRDVASLLLGSVNTSIMSQDPDDRFGVMSNPDNFLDPNTSNTLSGVQEFEAVFHTFGSYAPPLILSVGLDNDSGLFEPYDTTNNGHLAQPKLMDYVVNPGSSPLADNLTNHMQGLGN